MSDQSEVVVAPVRRRTAADMINLIGSLYGAEVEGTVRDMTSLLFTVDGLLRKLNQFDRSVFRDCDDSDNFTPAWNLRIAIFGMMNGLVDLGERLLKERGFDDVLLCIQSNLKVAIDTVPNHPKPAPSDNSAEEAMDAMTVLEAFLKGRFARLFEDGKETIVHRLRKKYDSSWTPRHRSSRGTCKLQYLPSPSESEDEDDLSYEEEEDEDGYISPLLPVDAGIYVAPDLYDDDDYLGW